MTETNNDQAQRIAGISTPNRRQSQRLGCAPALQEVTESLIPRSRDRGPIEAEDQELLGAWALGFRGHVTAAPLKRTHHGLPGFDRPRFRGHVTAAPLKRRWRRWPGSRAR